MAVGNFIRNLNVKGEGFSLHLTIQATTQQALAGALWEEARAAARAAATIEREIRPYPWDKALDNAPDGA